MRNFVNNSLRFLISCICIGCCCGFLGVASFQLQKEANQAYETVGTTLPNLQRSSIEAILSSDNGNIDAATNLYLVNDRDYPEDGFEVWSDYTLIGYYYPVDEDNLQGAYEFEPLIYYHY